MKSTCQQSLHISSNGLLIFVQISVYGLKKNSNI